MDEPLRPCPFCGSNAEYFRVVGGWGTSPNSVYIKCSKCWCKTSLEYCEQWLENQGTVSVESEAKRTLARAWNTREGHE